jgi:hypothetical protein
MNTILRMMAAAAIFALSICVVPARDAAADSPILLHARELTVTAVVEDIDHDARIAILRGPAGNRAIFAADASVRNFDQVKKGDKVRVTYVEAVAVQLMSPENAGAPGQATTAEVAPLGAKPGMVAAKIEQDSVVIQAIDYPNRLATLRMSDGTSVMVELDPRIPSLAAVKAGDHIVVRRTSAIAIAVQE